MTDKTTPDSENQNPPPAHDTWPGIGRVTIPLPAELLEDDGLLVLDAEQVDALASALSDAQDARLHLAAMLEVLQKCHPAYKIEAGLYVGNLLPILARMVRVIESLRLLEA
jgi:hypothetical protein